MSFEENSKVRGKMVQKLVAAGFFAIANKIRNIRVFGFVSKVSEGKRTICLVVEKVDDC